MHIRAADSNSIVPSWLSLALIRLHLQQAEQKNEVEQRGDGQRFRDVPVTELKNQLTPQEESHFTCFNYRLMERHGVRKERC